jgi:hypothetical protein
VSEASEEGVPTINLRQIFHPFEIQGKQEAFSREEGCSFALFNPQGLKPVHGS